MVRDLLVRGMLVGILAGFLAFGFARIFGEPQIDRAIAFEEKLDAASGGAPEPALVSRETQKTIGLASGTVVYGAALGGIFALVFAYAYGRVGKLGARELSASLALGGFITIALIPGLKYPANPPSVGLAETIGMRTAWYFAMLLVSVAAMVTAINLGKSLWRRLGPWNASLVGAAVFILICVVAALIFPAVNEVPEGFSAALLWQFRVAALGVHAVTWACLGLVFGALTELDLKRSFVRRAKRAA